MSEITLYLPTAVDESVTESVKRDAAETFGGFTVTRGQGGWVSPSGTLVEEPVRMIKIAASGRETAESWAESKAAEVARLTDETEVMWQVREVTTGFAAAETAETAETAEAAD
jgi:hypothetical protein